MNKMKENKKMYLTPKVTAVVFKVEVGYEFSIGTSSAADETAFTTIEPNGRNNAYSLRGGADDDNWVPFQ